MVEESHKEKSGVSETSETDRLRKRVEELESRERQREREEELDKKVERRLGDFQKEQRRQQQKQREEASEKQKKQSAVWAVAIVFVPLLLIFGWPLGPILFGYSIWVAFAIMVIMAIIAAMIRKLATGSYSAGRYFD